MFEFVRLETLELFQSGLAVRMMSRFSRYAIFLAVILGALFFSQQTLFTYQGMAVALILAVLFVWYEVKQAKRDK
ncbi:hypothetical protein [Marivita sp.]|uniref:hypothetical protein n=1 Tax=Marivita sp. TaxID=2003365 RepID=UPI0025C09B52|nr:hypothetical protein [Marivita sp.]